MPGKSESVLVGTVLQLAGAELGRALARGIVQGLQEQFLHGGGLTTAAMPARPRSELGAAAVSAGGCAVPGCPRSAKVKGLCGNHYGKARRLKMGTDSLTATQLEELARDGRAHRP